MKYTESINLRKRADRVLTISPFSRDAKFFGGDDATAYPQFLSRGYEAHVWDVDGNKYLDWTCSLGPTLLGYGYNQVAWAVADAALHHGPMLPLPHIDEVEVAEKLVAFCPIEDTMVRFSKTGSDACAMAIRLARAVTGRHRVLSIGFHGTTSEFVAATAPAWGVPPELAMTIIPVPANDLLTIEERMDSTVACVILEHGTIDPDPDYYEILSEMCRRNGSLLVMDEIVTGLRWQGGSVCHQWNVDADLVCYGKALANGHPLSALVGKRDHMQWFNRQDPVFVSTTFAGEATALAAANVVLDTVDDDVRLHVETIGAELMDGLNGIGDGIMQVIGHPCRSLITFPHGNGWLCKWEEESDAARGMFIQEMARQNIIINRPTFASLAHTTEDVEKTLGVAEMVLAKVREEQHAGTLARAMEGRMPRKLFADR